MRSQLLHEDTMVWHWKNQQWPNCVIVWCYMIAITETEVMAISELKDSGFHYKAITSILFLPFWEPER